MTQEEKKLRSCVQPEFHFVFGHHTYAIGGRQEGEYCLK